MSIWSCCCWDPWSKSEYDGDYTPDVIVSVCVFDWAIGDTIGDCTFGDCTFGDFIVGDCTFGDCISIFEFGELLFLLYFINSERDENIPSCWWV